MLPKIKKHKVFVSYHHKDQKFKDHLISLNRSHDIFDDRSLHTGDISSNLPAETIRKKIRDEYLRDSTVTILLAGEKTAKRKYVDWELQASMTKGRFQDKSGILVINLPTASKSDGKIVAAHGEIEKELAYSNSCSFVSYNKSTNFMNLFPHMPIRILDNLGRKNVSISIVPWSKVEQNPDRLKFLIDLAFKNRKNCNYNTFRDLKSKNS